MKSFLTAGFALATCAAFAAMPEQDFDGLGDGAITDEGNWKGGVVEPKTTGSEDKVLAIDGTVSCSNDVNSASSEFVKTSFKVLAPADATADLPTGTELADCQIAIATGDEVSSGSSNLKVMVYQGATTGWVSSGLTVAKDDWFEVTLHFDYTAQKAKVQIGNNVSTNLFNLVTAPNGTTAKINSLSFVGSSKIDNVSIDEAITRATLTEKSAGALVGLEVYQSDLTAASLETKDLSNANVIKSITAGLTPTTSEVTFNATALSTESTQTVITVPCDKDYGQVYNIAINDGTTTTKVEAEAGAIQDNSRALKFSIPSSARVLKFQVEASAPSNS